MLFKLSCKLILFFLYIRPHSINLFFLFSLHKSRIKACNYYLLMFWLMQPYIYLLLTNSERYSVAPFRLEHIFTGMCFGLQLFYTSPRLWYFVKSIVYDDLLIIRLLESFVIEDSGTTNLQGAAVFPWKSFLYIVLALNGKFVATVWYVGLREVTEFLPPQFR
jgi:hypothetical protein